jgi:glycosyltransferase involved in cell wall biosynthesis
MTSPLISCLMVSRGGLFPARFAIDCYRRQSWPHRELIILIDRDAAALQAHVAALGDASIRIVRVIPAPLGSLRNAAVAVARGDYVAQWDDDDLSAPSRLTEQMAVMGDAAAVLLHRWIMWWPARYRLAISDKRGWEGTMLARADAVLPYPDKALAEDTAMVGDMLAAGRDVRLYDRPDLYCYVAHGRNAWNNRHFEGLFTAASQRFEFADYDRALATLDQFPIAAYAAEWRREYE